MTDDEILAAFQKTVRRLDNWRGYFGDDEDSPTDDEVHEALQRAREALKGESDEDWAKIGQLWSLCREWLRYHPEWSMDVNPWGIYNCNVVRVLRVGSKTLDEGNFCDRGVTLMKRLAKALEFMRQVDEGK